MTKKQRILAGVGIATLVAGGFVFAIWRKMPHNQLDVQGPFRSEVVALPRDRALGKPIIDVKLPIVGRFALPTPVVVSPDEMALLKGDDNVGGLLRLRTRSSVDQAAYRLGDITFWSKNWPAPSQLPVPFAYGDEPLKATFRWVNPKPMKVDLTLPALYRPAPKIPEMRLDTGQITVTLTPIPPKTTLPFVEYMVTVEGSTDGNQLVASVGGWGTWIRISGQGSRVRVDPPANYVTISIAALLSEPTKLARGPDGPSGQIRIRRPEGGDLFESYGGRSQPMSDFIAFSFDKGRSVAGSLRKDFVSTEFRSGGDEIDEGLGRIPRGKPFEAVLYRLGPVRSYQLETHIPKHAFMKSF